jgi:hypothetical protein
MPCLALFYTACLAIQVYQLILGGMNKRIKACIKFVVFLAATALAIRTWLLLTSIKM